MRWFANAVPWFANAVPWFANDIVMPHVVDDVLHHQARAFHIERNADGQWTANIVPGKTSSTFWSCSHDRTQEMHHCRFSGTMRIASGDIDGDQRNEMVVISDWACVRHA